MGQGIGQLDRLRSRPDRAQLSARASGWRTSTRGERGDVVERAFLRLLGQDASGDQNWKQYGALGRRLHDRLQRLPLRAAAAAGPPVPQPATTCRRCRGTSRSTRRRASSRTRTGSTTPARRRCRTSARWRGSRCSSSSRRASASRCVAAVDPRHRAPRRRCRARQLLARPLPLDRLHPAAALDRPRRDPDLAGRAADLPRACDRNDAPGGTPDDRARPGRGG